MTPRLLILSALLVLAGCTTLRPVALSPARPLDQVVAVGDRLVVTRQDGERITLVVEAVTAETMDGRATGSSAQVALRVTEVARIERREFDGVRTFVAVLVGGVVLYISAEAFAASSLLGG